jgi:cell wall-associated NlpC family hydrolase
MIEHQFVAAARGYIGVPCRHQGRSRRGLDCIGLVVVAARDCGLDPPVAATYGRMQAYRQFKPLLTAWCDRVGEPGPGIVALFMNAARLHVGILTAEGTIIHAPGEGACVKEHRLNFAVRQLWRPKWPS